MQLVKLSGSSSNIQFCMKNFKMERKRPMILFIVKMVDVSLYQKVFILTTAQKYPF